MAAIASQNAPMPIPLAGLGPEDQAAFGKLLGALAARVNDLDPVLTACEAVEDITAR
jgi:hypothetical protein